MITSQTIKEVARQLGTDLCGIAPVSRFDQAPKGFHPRDLFPQTLSVLVVAKRLPEGPFHSRSPIPYSVTNDVILEALPKPRAEPDSER